MTAARLRAWLMLWSVLMAGVIFQAGWFFYVATHTTARAILLPPGDSVIKPSGSRFRLVSVVQLPTYPTKYEAASAAPGATWVVVTFEATVSITGENCHWRLLGRSNLSWEPATTVFARERDDYCPDFPVGTPTLGETIFEVPMAEVPHLLGVYDSSWWDWQVRHYAMRPPVT